MIHGVRTKSANRYQRVGVKLVEVAVSCLSCERQDGFRAIPNSAVRSQSAGVQPRYTFRGRERAVAPEVLYESSSHRNRVPPRSIDGKNSPCLSG